MGEIYRAIGEEPVRLVVEEGGEVVGICSAVVVSAKRGRHLAVLYGPSAQMRNAKCEVRKGDTSHFDIRISHFLQVLVEKMKEIAKEKNCAFIRMSPFWSSSDPGADVLKSLGFRPSPLHMLAEHVWYLDLEGKTQEDVLMGMRKTTRNLIRRAEREGVVVERSNDAVRDLPIFFELYEETRRRHHFVPYPEDFIRAQVKHFSESDECALYIARFNGEPVAASVHMIYGGETSYHHGASTAKYPKCFASYALQWKAIRDAISRGDNIYNFWGIAPGRRVENGKWKVESAKHPFAGVTTFKTGFGGQVLELVHCMDLPITSKYYLTWGFEVFRKWKRGF